jgi:hypothetical protein
MYSFHIENLYGYWSWIFFCTLLMRVLFSALRANEYKFYVYNLNSDNPTLEIKKKYFSAISCWRRFKAIFHGFSKIEPYPDSWYNSAIGTFELYAFPIMMQQDKYSYIGAWLAFKLIGQWKMWNENRNATNRIVLATILQLLLCYFILIDYVS